MKRSIKLPNFFIAGVCKAGTTSLYHYLKQHPEIYMSPIKEPYFFARDFFKHKLRKDFAKSLKLDLKKYFTQRPLKEVHAALIEKWEDYVKLFEEAKSEKAIGEASVGYLYSQSAPHEIFKRIPEAKIIIVLRNPIERAFSHYLMDVNLGFVKEPFLELLKKELSLKEKKWGTSHLYLEYGLYSKYLSRYLKVFPSCNVKIYLFDDFKKEPKKILKDIFTFLNVDPNFKIDISQKYNKTQIPRIRNSVTAWFLRQFWLRAAINKVLPQKIKPLIKNALFTNSSGLSLSSEEKEFLKNFYKEEIKRLSFLLKRDFSWWLSC